MIKKRLFFFFVLRMIERHEVRGRKNVFAGCPAILNRFLQRDQGARFVLSSIIELILIIRPSIITIPERVYKNTFLENTTFLQRIY